MGLAGIKLVFMSSFGEPAILFEHMARFDRLTGGGNQSGIIQKYLSGIGGKMPGFQDR